MGAQVTWQRGTTETTKTTVTGLTSRRSSEESTACAIPVDSALGRLAAPFGPARRPCRASPGGGQGVRRETRDEKAATCLTSFGLTSPLASLVSRLTPRRASLPSRLPPPLDSRRFDPRVAPCKARHRLVPTPQSLAPYGPIWYNLDKTVSFLDSYLVGLFGHGDDFNDLVGNNM